VKAKPLDKLKNLDQGLWQGMRVDEIKKNQPTVYRQWQDHPDSVCPPQGETLAAARGRIQTAIAKLVRKHKTGSIALVLPEPIASLAASYLTGGDLGDLWRRSSQSGTWEEIDVRPQDLVHSNN
jgi:broad specificity phosphatase PhoE